MKKIDIAEETAFANGLPLGFYSVVSEGVHIFHAREKKKDPGCSTTKASSDSNDTEKI